MTSWLSKRLLLRPGALPRCALLWAALLWLALAGPSLAADRPRIEGFLETTGFDVAIESIALSAENAPEMLGLEAADFGAGWRLAARQVFDAETMRNRAVTILEATLDDAFLNHAERFYASDLGQRLVAAENSAHFAEDADKSGLGQDLVAQYLRDADPRLDLLRRLNHAIDPNDIGPEAVQEVQLRFLLAAAFAEVITLKVDEEGLRAMLRESRPALRRDLATAGLANAAYTYQDFSEAELRAYAEALEHPDMQVVYELMNAVHFEVMSNRFEALAARLGALQPELEL
ncbi:DUF2059 domain-containing protein [Shimia sp.]|uniref:DUF2059 domain-containing protein n=1 Tax=Shimia sp. TaxID=1954381 RepID=UPI003567E095